MAESELDRVPVSESMCRDRTDKILGKLEDIGTKLTDLTLGYAEHRAWHNGQETAEARQETAKAQSVSNASLVAKWVAVGISVSGILGTVIWYIARASG